MSSTFMKRTCSRRTIYSALAILSLPLVVVYTSYAVQNKPVPALKAQAVSLPEVSVVRVTAAGQVARIQGNGEVRPRYELTLTADVAGRVIELAPKLDNGVLLDSEAVLARIDPTSYQQALASAEQALAEAELALLLEQREAERARAEWQRAGLPAGEESPLLFREPQLAAARARVAQAGSLVKLAERDLSHTRISAPFDAVVVQRLVAPGQYVQPGDAIATLYSTDQAEVRLTLPQHQWALLPREEDVPGKVQATLTDTSGATWQCVVTRIDRHIDQQSRQRSLVVSIDNPLEQSRPLLAGMFLRVSLAGAYLEKVMAVPAGSLTGDGEIWYVDANDRLAKFSARVRFQEAGTLYVAPPVLPAEPGRDAALAILTAPLASYVTGQRVTAKLNDKVAG